MAQPFAKDFLMSSLCRKPCPHHHPLFPSPGNLMPPGQSCPAFLPVFGCHGEVIRISTPSTPKIRPSQDSMIITALATPSIPEKDRPPNETELRKAKEPDFRPYRVFPCGSPMFLLFLVFSLPLQRPETGKKVLEKSYREGWDIWQSLLLDIRAKGLQDMKCHIYRSSSQKHVYRLSRIN